MLKEHGEKTMTTEDSDEVTTTFVFKQHCAQLVKTAVKQDIEAAHTVIEALVEHGYTKKGSWEVNDAFVEALIELLV